MPIRASVHPQPEPGRAILRLVELDAAPEGLQLSIQRQLGSENHLADDGWRRSEAWLVPAHVERSAGAIDFHLGPEICDRLAGTATVRLRIKEPDIGVIATTVVAWPPMLTSGAYDPGRRAADETVKLKPAPAPAPMPAAPPPAPPPLIAERAPPPAPVRSVGVARWAIVAAVLVALAGGALWYGTREAAPPPVAVAPPAPPTSPPAPVAAQRTIRDEIADYLAGNPTPEAMLARARALALAGESQGAFLVFRRAAEAGHAEARYELARFFDPAGPRIGAFAADGARAADWYERAALAGFVPAQRQLGLLLAKGGAGLAADPTAARGWLAQAAAQNDAEARKALDALPK
ncbi:MAG: sel1 repeat family protein [Alphaproteobacteria bacterium]|nr:sel1 repeat family protein [Alphaproteobacteria bacterium]